ncbi:MAG: AAA family ATPase [Aquificaceae bacterium]
MGFLSKVFGKKKKEETATRVITPKGELRLYLEDFLEKDPAVRIEEFWIETLDVSQDGYWLMVGRRHGLLELYDWSGKLHRLPSRPPAQVITDILFKDPYLALITPPYLVVYLLEDKRNPKVWKSFRTTQEGVRASAGLDISGNLLVYGVVGERVYLIDISGGFDSEGLDFKKVFSYSEADIGELRLLRFVGSSKLLLSGTKAVALYDLGGNLLRKLPHGSGKGSLVLKDKVLLSDGNKILLYDNSLELLLSEVQLSFKTAQMDLSPDGDLLFLADAEENRLGIMYMPTFETIGVLEGFGYSVVRVSLDGTLYTCSYKKEEDKLLYLLRAIKTNLTDFLYHTDQQSRIVRRAEKELSSLKAKLKKLNHNSNPRELEEYKRLSSMDMPIRRLREVILEAEKAIDEAEFEAFLRYIEIKISEDTITGEDLKEVEERLRIEEGERLERLTKLKGQLQRYFQRRLRENLQKVKDALSKTHKENQWDWEALEEIKETRAFLSRLPQSLVEEGQREIRRLIQEKLLQDKLRKYKIRVDAVRVYFGSEDFPIFSGERKKLRWRIRVEDRLLIGEKVYVRIAFEREDGLLFEPKRYPSLLPQEELKTLPDWIRRYLRHLRSLYAYEPPRVPLFVSYEETPWFVKNLQKFASLIKEQLLYSEGILILEGDAGVGKNFLVEVFSALTNRPLYIVPCNSKMEKEDITFLYEFDPKRGTKRVYSNLIKALQTPGAVVYFDEINTLPAGMVKLFNPLFDYRRYITLPTGEAIKANIDVILVGGMNPQNYLGVSELPQDIKSRADIIFIDYPPFEEEGIYSVDEALILKDYIPEFSFLSSEDFFYAWHWVINDLRVKAIEGTERLEENLWKLFELIKIASEVRKAYRAYQTQRSEEPVDFVFSIRDTIRCARRLNRYAKVKDLVLNTILPKVSSPLEKEILKGLVERV